MIRKLDQAWASLLCAVGQWAVRGAQACCRRERLRRFRRHLAAQRPELN